MKKALAVAGFLALLALTAPPGVGTHSAPCDGTTQYLPPNAREESAPAYVVLEEEMLGGQWWMAVWIYAESNGVTGLQRDDDVCYFDGVDESNADWILF